MKKNIKPLFFTLFIVCFMAIAQIGLSQAPLPPSDNGGNENRKPGGNTAPLDGGLYIALAISAGFGVYKLVKVIQNRKQAAGN